MNLNRSHLGRRVLCAVCALTLLVTVASPAAFAADEAAASGTAETLTQADAAQMAEADAAVEALVQSEAYAEMELDQRQEAAQAQLDALAEEGLIRADSIYYDEENGMYSFTYDCGVLGGILLTDWEEEDETLVQLPLDMPEELAVSPLDEQNDTLPLGNAIIYYAFDNTVNSSRYPNYTVMQENWTKWGLNTTLDTEVTVNDLKHMDDYDLCILSTHGAYYTYNSGWLFPRLSTAPVLILREESFGGSNQVDLAMSKALLEGGASAVVGFVNNVYTIYSRNILWGTVNQLIMGKNILQAVDSAVATYGSDDVYWYLSQGGTSPHRYAAFVLVHGNDQATLYTLDEGSAAA